MGLDIERLVHLLGLLLQTLGTTYTLNGLSDGTDYEFEVRSMCGGAIILHGYQLPLLLYWHVLHNYIGYISWDAI